MATKDSEDQARTRAATIALLVPESARENYRQMLTEQARREDVSLDTVRTRQIEAWRTEAETNPLAATGPLADWLESVTAEDLVSGDLDPSAVARVKGVLNVKAEGLSKHPVDLTDAEIEEIEAYRDAVNGQSPEQLAAKDAAATGTGVGDIVAEPPAAPTANTGTGKGPVASKGGSQK